VSGQIEEGNLENVWLEPMEALKKIGVKKTSLCVI
jgi:hypothetical protein